MKAILLGSAALPCAFLAQAADIQVPADQPTIQQAIAAAQSGDRVLVAPGVYAEHIDYLGKAIEVIGVAGAEATILDGGGSGRVVTFQNGETKESVLTGFTITHGKVDGPGMDGVGGGILVKAAWPMITHNVVRENQAWNGGGIAVTNGAHPRIAKNTILHNAAVCGELYGGGIYQESDATTEIVDNRIWRNAASYGGGVAMVGALPGHQGKVVLERNVISGNSAAQMGGGVFARVARSRFYSNLVVHNDARLAAGMYVVGDSDKTHATLTNNTLAENGGDADFSAVTYGQVELFNNILYASRTDHIASCQVLRHGRIDFHDNLAFGLDGANVYGDCTILGSLLTVPPQFVGGRGGPAAFGLRATSLAIDVGDNAAVKLHPKDLLGAPRIINGTVDLGALEFRTE